MLVLSAAFTALSTVHSVRADDVGLGNPIPPAQSVPAYLMALVCRASFSSDGDHIQVDSFDSTDTNYSSTISNMPGQYDATKSKSGADVGVISGAVNIASGTLNGHLHTGPGSIRSQVEVGPFGAVGDIDWTASYSGIEGDETPSSWWQPDLDATVYPDIPGPFFISSEVPADGILNGGGYITADKNAAANLTVTAPSVLWVQGSATFNNITIVTTNNASLVIFVGASWGGADTLKLSGAAINSPGYAQNLKIYGLPSLSNITVGGNVAWSACIYAPEADASFGGGSTLCAGPVVVNSITLTGHVQIHCDESLRPNVAAR